jgi:hypothetical protein
MLPDDLRPQTAGDPLPSAAVVERGLAGCEGEELVCGGVPGACSEGQAIRVRNHECRLLVGIDDARGIRVVTQSRSASLLSCAPGIENSFDV